MNNYFDTGVWDFDSNFNVCEQGKASIMVYEILAEFAADVGERNGQRESFDMFDCCIVFLQD